MFFCWHEKICNIITHIILVIQVPNQSVAEVSFFTSIEHHVKFLRNCAPAAAICFYLYQGILSIPTSLFMETQYTYFLFM